MKLTDSLPGTNITKFQVTQGILMMKAPSGLRYMGREKERGFYSLTSFLQYIKQDL